MVLLWGFWYRNGSPLPLYQNHHSSLPKKSRQHSQDPLLASLPPPPFCSSSSLLLCGDSQSSAICWSPPGAGHHGQNVLYTQRRLRETHLEPEVTQHELELKPRAAIAESGNLQEKGRQGTNEGTKLLPVSGAKAWPGTLLNGPPVPMATPFMRCLHSL